MTGSAIFIPVPNNPALLAEAVEYIDCLSAEKQDQPQV